MSKEFWKAESLYLILPLHSPWIHSAFEPRAEPAYVRVLAWRRMRRFYSALAILTFSFVPHHEV